GPLVCACFGVGLNVIRAALASGRAASVEQIGVALRAGTNCGSCLPELKRIVGGDRCAQTACRKNAEAWLTGSSSRFSGARRQTRRLRRWKFGSGVEGRIAVRVGGASGCLRSEGQTS